MGVAAITFEQILEVRLLRTVEGVPNIGAVNLQNSDVEVTWTLYDKNNAAVSSKTVAMPPYGVIAPTSITSGFFFDAGNADLTNAWVSFSSTGPIDAYASIVDNRTTDPTFIPAQQIFQ